MIRTPRDYQRKAADNVYVEWWEKNLTSTIIVLPTGTGKTVVASTIVHEHQDKNILFLAHREELIFQARDKIGAELGYNPQIEKAELKVSGFEKWGGGLKVIASVQTMWRKNRHEKFKNAPFDIIIVDEAHHAVARSYRIITNYFLSINPKCKVLGLTATPGRTDGIAMGAIFDSCAYRMSIEEAIPLGWLVPIRNQMVRIDKVSLDHLKTAKNEFGESDFNQAELADIFAEEETAHAIARPLLDHAGERAGPVFCAGVTPSHVLASVLNRYKTGCAAALDCNTPTEERRRILRELGEGRLQFVCNFGILTEGWDSPRSSIIGLARPTKSPQLATQMLGRVLRPQDGVVDGYDDPADRRMAILTSNKPYALCLDYVCTSRHKLVTVTDVLGGNFSLEELDRAEENSRGVQAPDVLDELNKAQAELILESEQKRREKIRAEVKYSTHEINLLGKGSVPHVAMDLSNVTRGGSTDSQINYLVNSFGFSRAKAAGFTKKQAATVIDKMKRERDGKPCSDKQRSVLIRFGEDPSVNWATANRIISEIQANGWRRRDVKSFDPDEGVVHPDWAGRGDDGENGDEPEFGFYG
jgi:superfamily II DNA or RNA helicase